ncbi:MAG: DUF4493 domain-containing protein [Bacteroidales bacterium]|nr:DUF4493 domain-containing protein [Bacteroidales bacterium]
MKKLFISLTILCAALVSCKRDANYGSNAGIKLSIDAKDSYGTKSDDVVSVDDFVVSIKNIKTQEILKDFPCLYKDVPSVVAMDPDLYEIEAYNTKDLKAGFRKPVFDAVKSVDVKIGEVTPISLVCKIVNMKVTIKTTERFENEMSDYSVTVTNTADPNDHLVFEKEQIAGDISGYFDVAPLEVWVKATRKNGLLVSQKLNIQNCAARDHHLLNIDCYGTGSVEFETGAITIDYTLNPVTYEFPVDSLSEEPVDDFPPSVVGSSIPNNATNVPVAKGSIKVTFDNVIALAENHGISLVSGGQAVAITPSASGKVLTIEYPELAAESAYTLTVPAGAVVSGQKGLENEFKLNFTTAAAPAEVPITITSPGIDTPVQFKEGEGVAEFNMTATADNGIDNFIVVIASPALRDMLDMVGQGADYNYTVDLANMDEAQTEFWGSLFGITSEDVKGKNEITLSVAAFTALMPVDTNLLNVTVKDTQGNSKSATITIIVTAN